MAGSSNKKRSKNRAEKDTSLWGFLFDKNTQGGNITKTSFFAPEGEEDASVDEQEHPRNLLLEIWQRFNFWSILATLVFLAFTIVLISTVISMWTPQNMSTIAGYTDRGTARDLTAQLRNANGQPITFTEAELNRYLRETCRMRQTGVFSIITHGAGVGVRFHNGYAEFIIDRLIGANVHQTISVNLSFHQEITHGRPHLKVNFRSNNTMLGGLPVGGSIGMLRVPERHISMLEPALDSLLKCYPEIEAIMNEHGYCPHFIKGENGNESYVRLEPYRPS